MSTDSALILHDMTSRELEIPSQYALSPSQVMLERPGLLQTSVAVMLKGRKEAVCSWRFPAGTVTLHLYLASVPDLGNMYVSRTVSAWWLGPWLSQLMCDFWLHWSVWPYTNSFTSVFLLLGLCCDLHVDTLSFHWQFALIYGEIKDKKRLKFLA